MLKKFRKRNAAALLWCFAVACSLYGCTDNSVPATPDVSETAVTEESAETEAPVVTEPEPETVVRSDYSEVKKKPEESVPVDIYSTLSDFTESYEVADSYYRINFVDDELFREEINNDIREAMDSLRKFHTPDYNELAARSHSAEVMETGGVVADIICRNGFLSVMLEYGYVEPFSQTQAGPYSVLLEEDDIYFDHAVTLNYDLISKNRITDFSDLFYDGTDWNSTIRYAEDSIYDGSVPYYTEEKPELFTIDYIIYSTEEEFAAARYNKSDLSLSYCSDMIPSNYRDMKSVCSKTDSLYYNLVTEKSIRTCDNCGQTYEYRQFDTSRLYDDDQIAHLNAELDKLYDHGMPGRQEHECFRLREPNRGLVHYTPDICKRDFHIDLWGYSDFEGLKGFYDPDTYERLTANDILGYDWSDYAKASNDSIDISSYNPDSFRSLCYDPASDKVKASFDIYSEETGNVTVNFEAPADAVNQKYPVR